MPSESTLEYSRGLQRDKASSRFLTRTLGRIWTLSARLGAMSHLEPGYPRLVHSYEQAESLVLEFLRSCRARWQKGESGRV